MNTLLKTRLQKLEQRLNNGNEEEFYIDTETRFAVYKAFNKALEITDFNTRVQAVSDALSLVRCKRTRLYTAAEQAALVDEYNRLALEGRLPDAEK